MRAVEVKDVRPGIGDRGDYASKRGVGKAGRRSWIRAFDGSRVPVQRFDGGSTPVRRFAVHSCVWHGSAATQHAENPRTGRRPRTAPCRTPNRRTCRTLPSRRDDPPKRLVDRHHRRVDPRLGLRDGVLRLELGALGVEQRQEVGDAFAVAGARDPGRASALAGLVGELDQTRLLRPIADERVLGFLERAQDGLVVLGQRLLRAGARRRAAGPGRCRGRSRPSSVPASPPRRASRRCRTGCRGPASKPRKPEMLTRGKEVGARRCPRAPLAAATRRSAARTSGRRCSSCAGSPSGKRLGDRRIGRGRQIHARLLRPHAVPAPRADARGPTAAL